MRMLFANSKTGSPIFIQCTFTIAQIRIAVNIRTLRFHLCYY